MDNQKIQEHVQTVREAIQTATPGPWSYYKGESYTSLGGWESEYVVNEVDCQKKDDAHLIANSPTWLQQSIEIIEQQQLEINDWEDECAALQRRYEDLDKSALETMNLLHETSHKVEQQQEEIEQLKSKVESLEKGWDMNG